MLVRGPYRVWLGTRVALANVAILLLALAISAATDEGGVPLASRIGRVLPLVPLASALAVKAVLASAKTRGEIGALAALGTSPHTVATTGVLAALVAPLVAALALLSGRAPVEGFFPAPPAAPRVLVAERGFVSHDLAIAIDERGELSPLAGAAAPPGADPLPRNARGGAAAAVLVGSLALGLALARERSKSVHHAPAVLLLVAALLAFQLAAARLVSAFAPLAPMLALLLVELRAYRRER